MPFQMSTAPQDSRVFSIAIKKLAISRLPCDLTEEGLRNLLPKSAQPHILNIHLVQVKPYTCFSLRALVLGREECLVSTLHDQGKKERRGLNTAFLALSSASASEDVMEKLHETPPLNLTVTQVASWKDQLSLGEEQESEQTGVEGPLGEESNNAEDVFVFGSPLVLNATGDEVKVNHVIRN